MTFVRAVLLVVPAAVALVAYERGVRRVRAHGGRWSTAREVGFVAGVACVVFGVAAPVGDRFSGHVVEHLLLGLVGPGLIAAGAPITLTLRSSSRPMRRRVRRVVHSSAATIATHPVFAVGAAVLGPWLVWLSPLDGWQRDSIVVHAAVHLHLVAAGLLFGIAVLGLDHTRWRRSHGARLLAAALALPLHALLGLVILSADTPFLNPAMATRAGLDDQQLGAALLWVVGDVIATVAMIVVGLQWASWERRDVRVPVPA